MEKIHNLIIIGSGPSGLTAAIYSARANLEPLIFAGEKYGGQLMTTSVIENFPGFPEGIVGPELMMNMITQAKRFGTEFINKSVTKVDFKEKIKKIYVGESVYYAKSVIIATGSSSRKLGLKSEEEFWGKGVSTCATCDGAFYRGKIVAVVGGGDSAMEESIFLTKFASKVIIIYRGKEFKASKIMSDRALQNPKIEVMWNSEVQDIKGNGQVEFLEVKNNIDNSVSEIKVDGMFLAIGHIPNTSFLGDSVELDSAGFVKATKSVYTNVEGVFVAGDVYDHHYQQAITAAGMGCMAAMDCEKWLESNP